MDEGGGELDPLLVAVRQLLELRLLAIGEAEPFQPPPGRRIGRLARHAVLLAEVAELLADAHPRVQAALLGHVPEAQPRDAVDRTAGPAHLAAIGPGQPEDAAHRGRLAGAVRSEEADDAAGPGRERGAVERDDVPVALGEVDDLEHGQCCLPGVVWIHDRRISPGAHEAARIERPRPLGGPGSFVCA